MQIRCLFTLAAAGLAASVVSASPAQNARSASESKEVTSLPKSLWVDAAPTSLRPYLIPHYASAQAVAVGSQVYRFYVTGPSSNYAFTLMGTNAPNSDALGVLPHIHEAHYENFFSLKGSFQLWAEKDNGTQQTRVLSQGDYGSVVRNTTHTFQILDPDTEMIGAIVPGGFEDLFFYLGTNLSDTTHTPYVPETDNSSSTTGPDSGLISQLESFDVYAQLDFEERRDAVNGTAPSNTIWHDGANELGAAGEPYFIANGWGPKYLNSRSGYQIVQPFATPAQTLDVNFTLSTISISSTPSNETVPVRTYAGAHAFQVIEGALTIKIGSYAPELLLTGDVAFIPGNMTFQYWTTTAFTKFLLLASGKDTLDQTLIKEGESWEYVTFPTTW